MAKVKIDVEEYKELVEAYVKLGILETMAKNDSVYSSDVKKVFGIEEESNAGHE